MHPPRDLVKVIAERTGRSEAATAESLKKLRRVGLLDARFCIPPNDNRPSIEGDDIERPK